MANLHAKIIKQGKNKQKPKRIFKATNLLHNFSTSTCISQHIEQSGKTKKYSRAKLFKDLASSARSLTCQNFLLYLHEDVAQGYTGKQVINGILQEIIFLFLPTKTTLYIQQVHRHVASHAPAVNSVPDCLVQWYPCAIAPIARLTALHWHHK